jgi:hypothetical protein
MEIRLKTAHMGRLLKASDDGDGMTDYNTSPQTSPPHVVKANKNTAAATRIASRKALSKTQKISQQTTDGNNKSTGILTVDTMKLLFSQTSIPVKKNDDDAIIDDNNNNNSNSNSNDNNINTNINKPTTNKKRIKKQQIMLQRRAINTVLSSDTSLNNIIKESKRIRELAVLDAEQNGENGEIIERPVSDGGGGVGNSKKKRRKKQDMIDELKEKKFKRFQESLKIVPKDTPSHSTIKNTEPIINLHDITRISGIGIVEYNLIEARKADIEGMTDNMMYSLLLAFEEYVDDEDKDDELMNNVISYTEAYSVLQNNSYNLAAPAIEELITASLETASDPNSVLYRILAIKTIKKFRFDYVVNSLGSFQSRCQSYAMLDMLDSTDNRNNRNAVHNLPPVRVQEAIALQNIQDVKEGGNYDDNFSRVTPRLLLSKGVSSKSNHDKSNHGSIDALRKELELSESGLSILNNKVKLGVQWVKLNCPVVQETRNTRADEFCKKWGAEKLKGWLVKQDNSRLGKVWAIWQDYVQYYRNRDNVILYTKIKSCSKIYTMLYTFIRRTIASGLNQWKNKVISERNHEYRTSSVSIQRIIRGFNSRNYVKELVKDNAACMIQNKWKSRKARIVTDALRERKRNNDAAKYLQDRFRNYRKRGAAISILIDKRQNKSATILQSRIRGREDRERVKRLKEEREQQKSASVLQSRFRGYEARKEVQLKRKEKKRVDAAKRLQKWRRGVAGQLAYARKKLVKESANKIQGAVRIHLAKKTTAGKLQAYMHKKKMEAQGTAARKIQGAGHVYLARKRMNVIRNVKRNLLEAEAAVKIQGTSRQFLARRKVQKRRQQKSDDEEQDHAATILQGKFRQHESRKLVARKKQSKRFEEEEKKRRWQAQNDATLAAEMAEQDKAARVMQGKARQFGARKQVNKKRTEKLKLTSAKIIQRAYRTHRFLMKFNRKAHERKKRWMAEAEARAQKDEEERVKREAKEAAYAKKRAEIELAQRHASATKIQGVFRSRRARRKMQARRNELAVLEAAAEERRIEAQRNAAAQMISNFMRVTTAKIRVRRKKEEHQRKIKELEAAGDVGAAEIEKMKKEMMAEIQAMELSADMQAAQDRKDLDRQKAGVAEAEKVEQALENEQDEVERNVAAMKIQHMFKAFKNRKVARAKRKEKIALMKAMRDEAERAEKEEEDRERMEQQMRASLEADRRKKKLEKEKAEHKSATKIQNCYRTRQARRKVQKHKKKKMMEAEKFKTKATNIRKKAEEKKKEIANLKGMDREYALKELELIEMDAKEFEDMAEATRRDVREG